VITVLLYLAALLAPIAVVAILIRLSLSGRKITKKLVFGLLAALLVVCVGIGVALVRHDAQRLKSWQDGCTDKGGHSYVTDEYTNHRYGHRHTRPSATRHYVYSCMRDGVELDTFDTTVRPDY
jgi:hypothetical protein